MKLLRSLLFVKAEPISTSKAQLLKEFNALLVEVILTNLGKVKTTEQLLLNFNLKVASSIKTNK
jgi:hypothetical protein